MRDDKCYMSMGVFSNFKLIDSTVKSPKESHIEEFKLLKSCLMDNDTKTKLEDQFNVIERIATDKSLMVKSIALRNNSFLQPRKMRNISEDTFLRQCVSQIDQECLNSLKAEIDACPLSNKACDDKVLFNTIGMINSYKNQSTQFIWRRVKGDGNCFYRAVIFSYLEQLILRNQKQALMNFIYDFRIRAKSPHFIQMANDLKLNSESCLNYLIMIHYSLNAKSRDAIKKSYVTFLKMVNNYRNIDYCLVCYYHIALYDYLKENETKLYSEDFSVFLGNMLPSQYEDLDGNTNWEQFYADFLFKFYQEAEKIVIYLTPYLFNFSLEVLYYDEAKNERNEMVFFPSNTTSNGSEQLVIAVLYKKVHYDIIYKEEVFAKYEQYLSINFYSIKHNQSCLNCQETNRLVTVQKVFLCEECLFAEIKSVVMIIFLFYIQNNARFYLQKFDSIAKFKSYIIDLNSLASFSIEEGLALLKSGKTFEYLLNELKESLCAVCYQQFKGTPGNDLKLPCGCCFCSKECLKKYHDFIGPVSITKSNYICFCNTPYSPQQVMQAIELFDSYSHKCDELMRLFQMKTFRQCFMCLESIPYIEKGYIKIFFVKNHKLKVNNSRLYHAVCEKCSLRLSEQKKANVVHCSLCNDETCLLNSKQIPNIEEYKEL